MAAELDEAGRLDLRSDFAVFLTFFLNVDIYSPLTWGEMRDNQALATLNGPLLTRFLKRLEQDMPAQFGGVIADDYAGLVGRYGFCE
jgi:hypothetical protein